MALSLQQATLATAESGKKIPSATYTDSQFEQICPKCI